MDKNTCRGYDTRGEKRRKQIDTAAVMTLRIFLFLLVLLQHGWMNSRAREKGQSLMSFFVILYSIGLDAGLEMVGLFIRSLL